MVAGVVMLGKKSIAGEVWQTTLTSLRCYCAVVAFTKVISIFDSSSTGYLTSLVSGITSQSPQEMFASTVMIGFE